MKKKLYLPFLLSLVYSINSFATVVIEGTRIVFPESKKDISIKMKNSGDEPALMQVWIDKGDERSTPKSANAPFILTPPIFRINPGDGQSVRVMFIKEELPADRESLFYFNALEVPPMPSNSTSNFMQVAVKSRLKFFYRPSNLQMDRADASGRVKWSINTAKDKTLLLVNNESPYYMTYSSIELENGKVSENLGSLMVAPFSQESLIIKNNDANDVKTIKYRALNDYGPEGYKTVTIE